MNLPPELLSHIGCHLDPESRHVCVAVCRDWKQIFTPHLWSEIDTGAKPWRPVFRFVPPAVVSDLLSAHRRWIRDLSTHNLKTLNTVLHANLRGLSSLRVHTRHNVFSSPDVLNVDPTMFLNLLTNDEKWDDHIQSITGKSIFYDTLALWRLVLTNPGLRRLELLNTMDHSGYTTLDDPVVPAESFLVLALSSRLPALVHLEVGWGCGDVLLCELAGSFPNLQSFGHVGQTVDFLPECLKPSCHLNLRVLAFRNLINADQMRAVLLAFPGLQSLTVTKTNNLRNHRRRGVAIVTYMDFSFLQRTIVEHKSLKSLDICDLSLVEKANIRLSRIQTLTCTTSKFPTIGAIQTTLNLCPTLDRLEFRIEQQQRRQLFLSARALSQFPAIDYDPVLKKDPHPLKTLIYADSNLDCFTSDDLISRVPFLTRLDLGIINVEVLVAMTTTCTTLEYVRFSLDNPYPAELSQLFVSCSRLKECRGDGHIIAADDLINGPEWTCMGLEKLDIDIQGLPRLDVFRSSSSAEPETLSLPSGAMLDTTTDSTTQQNSYAIRRKVFASLALHKYLVEIKFGSEEPSMEWRRLLWSSDQEFDTYTGLEFSLESGFGVMAALPRLERLEICEASAVRSVRTNGMPWMQDFGWRIGAGTDAGLEDGVDRITLFRTG